LPNPAKPRGREALSRIYSGRVKMDGDTALGLKLLQLLAV
jgi:ubiquinone biosynthesis protein UbiJ